MGLKAGDDEVAEGPCRGAVALGVDGHEFVVLENLYGASTRADEGFFDELAREVFLDALSFGIAAFADAACEEALRARGCVVAFAGAAAADAYAAVSGRTFAGRAVVATRRTRTPSRGAATAGRHLLDGAECALCLAPQVDSILLRCCGLSACKGCVVRWARGCLEHEGRVPTCPTCRADLEDVRLLADIRSDEDFRATTLDELLLEAAAAAA